VLPRVVWSRHYYREAHGQTMHFFSEAYCRAVLQDWALLEMVHVPLHDTGGSVFKCVWRIVAERRADPPSSGNTVASGIDPSPLRCPRLPLSRMDARERKSRAAPRRSQGIARRHPQPYRWRFLIAERAGAVEAPARRASQAIHNMHSPVSSFGCVAA